MYRASQSSSVSLSEDDFDSTPCRVSSGCCSDGAASPSAGGSFDYAGGGMPSPSSAPDSASRGENEEMSMVPPELPPELPPAPAPTPSPESAPGPALSPESGEVVEDNIDNSAMESGAPEPPAEVSDILREFSDAYAWIEITGELPEFLKSYEPVPLYDLPRWGVYYKLPRDAGLELIREIRGRYGVAITLNYENSDYAIVFYSPGG